MNTSPSPLFFIHHKPNCTCGGGCPSCQREEVLVNLQPKLKIGAPNDKYEQEADRVADHVMRMPEAQVQQHTEPGEDEKIEQDLDQTKPRSDQITPLVQRHDPRESIDNASANPKPGFVQLEPRGHKADRSYLESARTGGSLSKQIRNDLELRMGFDFSKVRLHDDKEASKVATSLGTVAFTYGQHIFVDRAKVPDDTPSERYVLAHELTHTVQQRAQAPSIMGLTETQFRQQLGSIPEQTRAIDTLFAHATFLDLWNYLGSCTATPAADLGPLHLDVHPGLVMSGAVRFGGYFGGSRTLKINPTKPEHVANPAELVDTITHELIHAVVALEAPCISAGSGAAPLGGSANVSVGTRAAARTAGTEDVLLTTVGPGASAPCTEFIDINATAQQIVINVLLDNIAQADVGRPTVIFVNEILRQVPAALTSYKACQTTACALSSATAIRTAMADCSAQTIGEHLPANLLGAVFPSTVYFDFASDSLRSAQDDKIKLVAIFLKAHPGRKVEIVGHTDPGGTRSSNLTRGDSRANAVAQELIALGVPSGQITSISSQGETQTVSTSTSERWRDRRAVVTLVP